jgi:hypothetical protein
VRLKREQLLRFARDGDGLTLEQAVRELINQVAWDWPERIEQAGPIDAEAEFAVALRSEGGGVPATAPPKTRLYRDRRSPEEQEENRETRFPETTGGRLKLPDDEWSQDPRTKSLSARIVELEQQLPEEKEE